VGEEGREGGREGGREEQTYLEALRLLPSSQGFAAEEEHCGILLEVEYLKREGGREGGNEG